MSLKSKKDKKPAEKPTYGTPRCLLFACGRVWRHSKQFFILVWTLLAANLIWQVVNFYFAPSLIGTLECGEGIGAFMLTLLVLGGGQALVRGIINYIDKNCAPCRQILKSRLTEEVTQKITATSYPNFLTEKFKNRTSQAFEATEGGVVNAFCNLVTYFLKTLILFGFYLYFLTDLHPLLGVVTGVLYTVMFFYNRWAYAWGQRHRDEESEVWRKWDYVRDNMVKLPLIKELKLFGMSGWIESIFREVYMISARLSVKREKFFAWRGVVNIIVNVLSEGFAFYILISAAIRGEITAARFVLLVNAIDNFAAQVGGVFDSINHAREDCLKVNNFMEFINYPEPFKYDEGKPVQRSDSYEIKLENVSYTYPGAGKQILDGFDLTIREGEKLAMVGLNGAGKPPS